MKRGTMRLVSFTVACAMQITAFPNISHAEEETVFYMSNEPITIREMVETSRGLEGKELLDSVAAMLEDSKNSGENTLEDSDDYVEMYSSGLTPESDTAITTSEPGTITWDIDTNGVLTITGEGDMEDYSSGGAPWSGLDISAVVIEPGITSVGNNAFSSCAGLEYADIPNTVTKIGPYSFDGCTALKKITIPESVSYLGGYTYRNCTAVTEIEWYAVNAYDTEAYSAPELYSRTFQNVGAATDGVILTFGDAVETVPAYAFDVGRGNNAKLRSISWGSSISAIGTSAFCDQTGITGMGFPDYVASIGSNAFGNCEIEWNGHKYRLFTDQVSWYDAETMCREAGGHLVTVTDETENKIVNSIAGNRSVWMGAKRSYGGGWEWITGEEWSYESWRDGEPSNSGNKEVFAESCSGNWNDIAPSSIGHFICEWDEYPAGTTDITLRGTLSDTIDWCLTDDMTLTITGSGAMPETFDYGTGLPVWNNLITKLVIEEGITSIGRHTFFRDGKLESVSLPSTLEKISDLAFGQCTALTEIIIPDSVTSIGAEAFGGCEQLSSVKLPSSITYIDRYAFSNCAIKDLELPDTVTEVRDYAFAWNYDLSVALPSDLTVIGSYAFAYCTGIKEIAVPEAINKIEEGAFCCCSGASTLTLPETLTEIGNNAFSGCSALVSADIPDSVTHIGNGAFDSCSSLRSVKFPSELKMLGDMAFIRCESLTDVKLPEGLTTLGNGVFRYCSELRSISIPGTVTSVGDLMFDTDTKLVDVELGEGMTMLGSRMFWGCRSLDTVQIPSTVSSIGSNAFNTGGSVSLIVAADSYAERWAIDNGYEYEYSVPGVYYRLSVTDENGAALTSGFDVYWYEKDGEEPIAEGTVLSGADSEKEYEYLVVLGEELGVVYKQPERAAAERRGVCTLERIPEITVRGAAVDTEKAALTGCEIVFTQLVNGRYVITQTAQTDEQGDFSAVLLNTQTEVLLRKAGYYDQRVVILNELAADGEFDMGAVTLRQAQSGIITFALQCVYAEEPGAERRTGSIYSTSGLRFEVYDVTAQRDVPVLSSQYPKLTIDSETVSAGDELVITVFDDNGRYASSNVSVTVDGNKNGSADIELVQNGSIHINTIDAENEVRVMLFGKTGYIGSYTATDDFETTELSEGSYSLVLMEKTDVFSAISDISRLEAVGLSEGRDYILIDAEVKAGNKTVIETVSVPELDEERLYFTVKDKTSLSATKLSPAVGVYVSMRAEYAVDSRHDTEAERVLIRLPENMELAEGSVTLNNRQSAYTYENNVLEVAADAETATVRFYAVASEPGPAEVTAELSFEQGGQSITQPIGNIHMEAAEAVLNVPSEAGGGTVTVSGVAVPRSSIAVYDNGVKVAETTANSIGKWRAAVDLGEPNGYKYHGISASVDSDRLNETIRTSERALISSSDYVGISKITMINTAHSNASLVPIEYRTVFDFINPSAYTPSYSYWPSYPTFTFAAEFAGDSETWLRDVYAVTTNSTGDVTYVPLNYDAATGQWIGKHDYATQEIPVKVGAAYHSDKGDPTFVFETMDAVSGIEDVVYEKVSDNEKAFSYKLDGKTETGRQTIKQFGSEQELLEYLDGIGAEVISEYDRVFVFASYGGIYGYYCADGTGGYIVLIYELDAAGPGSGITIITPPPATPTPEPSDAPTPTPTPTPTPEPSDAPTASPGPEPGGGSHNCGCLDAYENAKTFRDEYNALIYRLENCSCIYEENEIMRDWYLMRMRGLNVLINASMIIPIIQRILNPPNEGTILDIIQFAAQKITEQINNYEFPDPTLSLYNGMLKTMGSAKMWLEGGTGRQTFSLASVELMSYEGICMCERPEPSPSPGPGQDAEPVMDPSGYVCEAVPSNKVEGVTVTAYTVNEILDDFGEPTGGTETVVWKADDYGQMNPLITNVNGEYSWDVPVGEWQVKYEKEGYETAYSEWLSVPPPQTEVHVGLVTTQPPEVSAVSVYDTGIRLEFDQYMDIVSVSGESISVTADGNCISGKVEPVNAEASFTDPNVEYASVFMFIPDTRLQGDVSVSVDGVQNYNGIPMEREYRYNAAVGYAPESIEVQSVVSIGYNESAVINLRVLPAGACVNEKIKVVSSSPSIVSVGSDEITVDENGNASVSVTGKMPGAGEIIFRLDGTDIEAATEAVVSNVIAVDTEVCAAVTASIESGAEVEQGTAVELSTDTKDAQIYYTVDRSDPGDKTNPSRCLYTEPIVINENMYITACAEKEGCENSATASFIYIVKTTEPTEEPTTEPTEEPTTEPTEEPTPTAGPVSVSESNGLIVVQADFGENNSALTMYTAVYDEYGILIKLEAAELSTDGKAEIRFEKPNNAGNIKIMLWDNMIPRAYVYQKQL